MTASVGIVIILLTFVVPRMAGVFEGANIEPPGVTLFLIGLGNFLRTYIFALLIGFMGLVFGFFAFRRSAVGRLVLSRFYERVPILKDLIKKLAVTRFSATLASLMRGGLPILEALEITSDAVGNESFRQALLRISREEIAKGSSMGAAFRKEEIFPRTVSNLIAIGEKAGHTDEILETLSGFYEAEVDSTLKTLVSFLEPALLMGVGLLVGLIAVAVILPIYQLVSKF
jgi:type II secretory pathway component PulF